MRGESNLTRDADFQRVYNRGRAWAGKEVVVRALPTGLGYTRCGFVVGRRVGKAVVRNHIKRRLREILRQLPLPIGWDLIVIARAPAVQADFQELKKTIEGLLSKAGLVAGENESAGPGTN